MNRGYMALESVSVREFAKNMRDGQGGTINQAIKVTGKVVYEAGTVSEGKGNQGSRERKAGIKKIIKV